MQTKTFDPRIGILNRVGETVYYANLWLTPADKTVIDAEFIYVESTQLEEIETYLSKHG
jgi:hypothetical protein